MYIGAAYVSSELWLNEKAGGSESCLPYLPMKYGHKIIEPPELEPITVAALDAHLRGDGEIAENEAEFLESLITAARQYIETETRRALITQKHSIALNSWPAQGSEPWWDGVREGAIADIHKKAQNIKLPYAPLQSITQVVWYNRANEVQTYDPKNYMADTFSTPGALVINDGALIPTNTRQTNSVEIEYLVGYGDTAVSVPGALRQALTLLATHWYENREYVKIQSDLVQAPTPIHVQRLIDQYKVRSI